MDQLKGKVTNRIDAHNIALSSGSLHLFRSSFHFHIFPSKRFRSPLRSSGWVSSSTHPALRTFLAAPLPINDLVLSSLASACRKSLMRARWADKDVSRVIR